MIQKKIIWLFLLIFIPTLLFAQEENFWTQTDSKSYTDTPLLPSKEKISSFDTYQVNLEGLKSKISNAPLRGVNVQSDVWLDFPIAEKGVKAFNIFKVQTLAPEFEAKHPNINSYIGISKNKKNRIRITITSQGFYGMASSTNGDVFVNPYTKTGDIYQVFLSANSQRIGRGMRCDFENENGLEKKSSINNPNSDFANVDDGVLRTYRLAVATTGEYSQFHIDVANLPEDATDTEKKEIVLSAVSVTMDRVNEIYERDLSITMTLIDNEDIIFLDGANDPFNNNNSYFLLGQSQDVIDDNIGSENYDIGHTFSTGAGGLAYLGVVCTSVKARGVTGITAPVGDNYDIDFVAHEMGHQFGANHTFNGTSGNCGGNANPATAVEPGSGSTIMGYAGICGDQDVQYHSDSQFHAVSINEIYQNVTVGNSSSCGTQTTTENTAPVIEPNAAYTIPYGTAFELTTTATDADDDMLTYDWEQTDNEATTAPPSPTATQGAVFRSQPISESPTRTFPELGSVLNNNLEPTWEVVPNVARELNFACTVRDNNPLGGQSTREDVVITVADTGPFIVSSQNTTGLQYGYNDPVEVSWNVEGTTENGINAATVDILLSYNGGLDFTEVLASATPNDGSETITIPEGTSTTNARIKIKAPDNIFFAVNQEGFVISELGVEDYLADQFSLYPNPNNGTFTIDFKDLSAEGYTVSIFDLRGRIIGQYDIDPSDMHSKTIQMNQPEPGIYLIKISIGKQSTTKKLIVK